MLPAGTAVGGAASSGNTYTYYGDTATFESANGGTGQNAIPPCGIPGATVQAGLMRTSALPAPGTPTGETGSSIVTEHVYDGWGRLVATRRQNDGASDNGWICTGYDARGRTTTTTYPQFGAQAGRVVSTTHSVPVNGSPDPLTSSVSDAAGAIETRTDLLGRVTRVKDVWGVVTTTSYGQNGNVTATTTAAPGAAGTTLSPSYDDYGRQTAISKNGATLATLTYTPNSGELASVTFPSGTGEAGNGTSLALIGKDAAGQTTSLTWTFPAASDTDGSVASSTVVDSVTRSQAGRVMSAVLTDSVGSQPVKTYANQYGYDGAGRLVRATIPRHELTYDYTTHTTSPTAGQSGSGACASVAGAVGLAGRNGNRVRATDTFDGALVTDIRYCYDAADRLIATTNAVTSQVGSNPVSGVTLTADGEATIAYDRHGNTTRLSDQTLHYDVADRHMQTTLTPSADGVSSVTYVRDVLNRIVARTEVKNGVSATTRYGYTNGSDTADLILDAESKVIEEVLALPGGVVLTDRPGVANGPGADVWSYPNVHGDVVVTTNAWGGRHNHENVVATVPATFRYDPFGQPIDPSSGRVGTEIADDSGPDTLTGDLDNGWLGQHQRPVEQGGSIATIQMGARAYVPVLGRFLAVDPIEGGVDNDYAYVTDPINETDLSGTVKSCQCALARWLTAFKNFKWSYLWKGRTASSLNVAPRTIRLPNGSTVSRGDYNTRISYQRQGRHVKGATNYTGKGYFLNRNDAQRVLDDFHSGRAVVLGKTNSGMLAVRTRSVTGYNHNVGAGFRDQPTNVFFIKGTSTVSVVPAPPNWRP